MSILLNLVLVTLLTSLLLETMFPLAPASRELRLKALVSLSLAVAAVLTLHTSLTSIENGNAREITHEYLGGYSHSVIADYCLHHKPKCD